VEERLAAMEKTLADTRARAELAEKTQVEMPAQVFSPPGYWGELDTAAKAMKLDEATKGRLESIIEATKRNLDDLYARPNEEGLLWKDVNGGLRLEGLEQGELMTKLGEHMKKVASFRKSKVPGTSETYAEAERRIVKDGRDRARSVLDADQARVWDRSNPDPLFGAQGGGDGVGLVTVFSEPTLEFAPAK
jgi:hypothetical protein